MMGQRGRITIVGEVTPASTAGCGASSGCGRRNSGGETVSGPERGILLPVGNLTCARIIGPKPRFLARHDRQVYRGPAGGGGGRAGWFVIACTRPRFVTWAVSSI